MHKILKKSISPRVEFSYTTGENTEKKELPLRLLIIGFFTNQFKKISIEERYIASVNSENFSELIKNQGVSIHLTVPDFTKDTSLQIKQQYISVQLTISSLEDFSPNSLAKKIPELKILLDLRTTLSDKKSLIFLHKNTTNECFAEPYSFEIDKKSIPECWNVILDIDKKIIDIDQRIGRQLDAVLHHPDFQARESAWRNLKFIVDTTNFNENIYIHILSATKEELVHDFEDSPSIINSGLYKHVYASEYGQYGGEPFTAIIGDYEFGPGHSDIFLLKKIASISAMAHAPFIAGAGPDFFEIDSFEQLPHVSNLTDFFNKIQYNKWNDFRNSTDSRNVGLTLPKVLLRKPYDCRFDPHSTFFYKESVYRGSTNYLWGNSSFAFASRLLESFTQHRWCSNLVGSNNGVAMRDFSLHTLSPLGPYSESISTEVLISEARELELSELGFIALSILKNSAESCFYIANSCKKVATFGKNIAASGIDTDTRLGAQLQNLFIVNRIAHYLKVLQREKLGSWKNHKDLEQELNAWIGQYVVDMDTPGPDIQNTHPLRSAHITVNPSSSKTGWYKVSLSVRPHLKNMGSSFTLSLNGKMESSR